MNGNIAQNFVMSLWMNDIDIVISDEALQCLIMRTFSDFQNILVKLFS